MSRETGGGHHAHKRRRRRIIVDMLIILLFLLAIFAIIIGYLGRTESTLIPSTSDGVGSSGSVYDNAGSYRALHVPEGGASAPTDGPSENAGTTSVLTAPLLSPDSVNGDQHLPDATATDEPAIGGTTTSNEPLHFNDVTTVRYQNNFLGFVMETPDKWSKLYEHSDSVAFTSATFSYGATIEDVRKIPNAMWVIVGRPCATTEATSTSFVRSGSGVASILERFACVPPLTITLGLHADPANAAQEFTREQFLLDIARTIYPIVSGAPYVR